MLIAPQLKKAHEHQLPSGVLAADLSIDNSVLVAACMDGVYRLDLESGDTRQLYRHDNFVSGVVWVRDDLILSAGYDGVVQWFNPTNDTVLSTLRVHDFWSWDMAVSSDRKWLASVTGQYLAGGYKYEPAAEREPSLRIVSVDTGEIVYSLPHVPSVQSVAFSPEGRYVAAGNLMGEVRVYDLTDGAPAAQFITPDFTSWGVIKSHCYLGGIFALAFTPNADELLLAGMGPMHDPMAGNGKQRWQKWKWNDGEPTKTGQIANDQAGEGLMEALAVHPSGRQFAMAGRLRGGDWNLALFDLASGQRLAAEKTGYRITDLCNTARGDKLIAAGAVSQSSERPDGKQKPFGRVTVYELSTDST